MIPATGLKTSLLSLSLLQQIDLALFNKVFGYGKARQALTHTALAVSKVGMGTRNCSHLSLFGYQGRYSRPRMLSRF